MRAPKVDLRAIFLVKFTQFRTALCDLTRKSVYIYAAGSQLRNGSRLAPEVDLRANFLVKSHQGHGLEDTPVKHSSLLVVAKCKYRKALHPIISII